MQKKSALFKVKNSEIIFEWQTKKNAPNDRWE